MPAKVETNPKTTLQPPTWAFPTGAAAAVVSIAYILMRLSSDSEGLGLLPYMSVLLVAALVFLPECRDRIEVDDNLVVRYRGKKVIFRCPTRDLTEVRAGFLSKALIFGSGRKLSVRDYWINAAKVTNFFHRRLQTQAQKAQKDPIESETRRSGLKSVPTSRPGSRTTLNRTAVNATGSGTQSAVGRATRRTA